MNKASERYNTKVEIPISIILETIFSDDNHDVETLSRWAKHYNFVDLIEKEGKKYYQLQKDYKKQSFYIWLSKEERKQYEYEDYLLNEIEEKDKEIEKLKSKIKYLKRAKDIMYQYLQLIADIGYDYDGLNSVESLKGLIDEMVKYALWGRDEYDTEVIYVNNGKEYNILNEELKGDNNE